MPDSVRPLVHLLVALLIGLLVGLDRERAEVRKKTGVFAGVRTFPLIALAGAIPALLIDVTGPWLVVAAFAGVAGVAVVSYVRATGAGEVGATTEIAALATFLLGVLAGTGRLELAAASGVVVSVLLAAKPPLERFSRALTPEEVAATLELAVITVIVLPLLPNQGYGPGGVLNPREIWLIVVLVSALSFAGFVATRLLGEERGLAATGALGGIVSSTAVTVSMAQRTQGKSGAARMEAAAAVLASTLMSARVVVLTGAVHPGILARVVPAMVAMAAVGGGGAWLLARGARRSGTEQKSELRNPFSLRSAIGFGLMYGLVLLVVHGADVYLGNRGLFATAVLSGLVDVDAASIAFTRLGAGSSHWAAPAMAVTIAAVSNTCVKLGIAVALGRGSFRGEAAAALGAMAVAGLAVGVAVFVAF
jgi:uncharacterized membrane protein (DUF4010 family)